MALHWFCALSFSWLSLLRPYLHDFKNVQWAAVCSKNWFVYINTSMHVLEIYKWKNDSALVIGSPVFDNRKPFVCAFETLGDIWI